MSASLPPFLAAYADALTPGSAHSAAQKARLQEFHKLPFPSLKEEAWRFLRPKRLGALKLGRALDPSPVSPKDLAPRLHPQTQGRRLVLVDGVWSRELSDLDALPKGLHIRAFGEATAPEGAGGLAAQIQGGKDYFVALHHVLTDTGIAISVDPDCAAGPLHLLCVSSAPGGGLTTPRIWVEVAGGGTLTLVEEHLQAGQPTAPSLANVLVELSVASNATLLHTKIQDASLGSYHIARRAVQVADAGRYEGVTVSLGAALSRLDQLAIIGGKDASCALHGLAMLRGQQVSDTHSIMRHTRAHATSDQLHKCVIDADAHAIFNGAIHIEQGAQVINAFQLNRNLLLSSRAKIDTKPQLEIYADDVKCSHGATIGQLEDEQLFYLQSRGLQRPHAIALLTFAFAAEVLGHVPPFLRARLETSLLQARSPKDAA